MSQTAERAEPTLLDHRTRLAQTLKTEFGFVFRLLRRFGVDSSRLEDDAQQVFIILSRKLDQVPAGSERSFLLGTAVRVANNSRRTAVRRREFLSDDGSVFTSDPALSPEALLDHKQRRRLLDGLLEQLPFEQRSVLVLSELEGMSRREIAKALQLPVGTVASRLKLANAKFFRMAAELQARLEREHAR